MKRWMLPLVGVGLCVACSPNSGPQAPSARVGEGAPTAPRQEPVAQAPSGASQDVKFSMLVVEDRGGQLKIKSGHLGLLERLGARERRAVTAAWQQPAQAEIRPGVYCGRLLDPAQRQTAIRCVQPRVAAHLAPRKTGDPAVNAPLATVAFALRLPWPATATGGGWTLEVGAPDGRTATWRPRQ